jgi:hypothetical protein
MATADSANTGVGIVRPSLNTNLESRYNGWKGAKEREAPVAVNFIQDDYVTGFTMNSAQQGPSEIRAIGLGGPGAKSIYSEERGIPRSVNFLTDTYQTQFTQNQQVRVTTFKKGALNYVEDTPGFNNTKYWVGGIS